MSNIGEFAWREQARIQSRVLDGERLGGEPRQGNRRRASFPQGGEGSLREGDVRQSIERDIAAMVSANFSKRGNVRADNGAAGQKRFRDREAEAFDGGRSEQGPAVSIAPLQVRFGQSLQQDYVSAEARLRDCAPDA
jgi:hypothetical protein